MVKDPPARARDACSNPLDQEDTLEKEMATHSILARETLALGLQGNQTSES